MFVSALAEISPLWIPLAAMAIPIVAVIGGIVSQAQARRLKADQRMALLSRGMPLAEIEAYMRSSEEIVDRGLRDPMRSLANARRAAIVLISVGLGLMIFSVMLAIIVQERHVLAVAAAGFIPLMIGIGFVVDYGMQKREMSRFGLGAE
jgi:hypothetical protein